jgi:hypothetical protein
VGLVGREQGIERGYSVRHGLELLNDLSGLVEVAMDVGDLDSVRRGRGQLRWTNCRYGLSPPTHLGDLGKDLEPLSSLSDLVVFFL